MAQFRITQKFATDYKIKILAEPKQTNNIFDDWVIDRLIVKRKKVAMITHIRTVYTWLIPYSSVGGVKNIPNVLPSLLQEFLHRNDFMTLTGEMEDTFKLPHSFCKTQSRRVVGHMTDFKHQVNIYCYYSQHFEDINWKEIADRINDTPIGVKRYINARELFYEQLIAATSGV